MKKYEVIALVRAILGDVPGLHKLTQDEAALLLAAVERLNSKGNP